MFDIFNNIASNTSLNPAGGTFNSIGPFLGLALNIAMGASFTIALIATIVSGIQFVMSEGDPKAIATARSYLIAAIIAVILSLGGFTAKLIILNILGSTEGNLTNAVPTP